MINRIIEIHERLKSENPRIHMIPNEVSAAFCADVLAAAGAKPIMAIESKEAAVITKHAKCLVINMGQLTDGKYQAMQESVKVAEQEGIPVVLDPVGAGASNYRMEYANKLLTIPWKGILKLNRGEYEALTKQVLTYSGVDSKTGESSEKFPFYYFGGDRTCLLTGKEDLIGEARWEFKVKHVPTRLPQIVGSGCCLGALCGAVKAVETGNILAGMTASYLMSVAALQAEDKAKGYMDYKMYLIDAIYGIKEENLRKYADLLIERGE